jgi:hypothetical protein
MTDVHESCGVESTNGEVLAHLRALVHDSRKPMEWDDPVRLALVQYLLNDEVHSETGQHPFTMLFGDEDMDLFTKLRNQPLDRESISEAIKEISLKRSEIHEASRAYQSRSAMMDSRSRSARAPRRTWARSPPTSSGPGRCRRFRLR